MPASGRPQAEGVARHPQEEQQRDLTFHFEAQLKIAQEAAGSAGDLAGGGVELPEPPPRGAKAKGKRRSS